MAPRPFVPPELMTGPFRRADARLAGLTDKQLRSQCWVRPFHDVYLHASIPITDQVRLDALRLAAPTSAVVTGLTAAWLYGVWQPAPGRSVPLHLGAVRRTGPAQERSKHTRRLALDPVDVNELDGIGITSPERTCFGLMARGPLVEAVVFADAFGHAGLVTQQGLMRFADERPHWPHVKKARLAVDLSRFEAASPMETRLRMVIVLAGLEEPLLLNVGLHDIAGVLLGCPDMLYLAPLFGIEYDGAYHREPGQHARDNARENRLLLGDVPLLRYGAADVLRNPDRVVREVGAMLAPRSLRRAA